MNAILYYEWGRAIQDLNSPITIAIEGIDENLPINAYSVIYSSDWTHIENFITAKEQPYAGWWGNANITMVSKNTFQITGKSEYIQQKIDAIFKKSSIGQSNKFLQFSLSFENHQYYDLIINKYTLEGYNIGYSSTYYNLPSLVINYRNTNGTPIDLFNLRQPHQNYPFYYPLRFTKK